MAHILVIVSFTHEFMLQLVWVFAGKGEGGRMSLVCRIRNRHSSPQSVQSWEFEAGGGGEVGVEG